MVELIPRYLPLIFLLLARMYSKMDDYRQEKASKKEFNLRTISDKFSLDAMACNASVREILLSEAPMTCN